MKTRLGVRVNTYPYPLPRNACFADCNECGNECVVGGEISQDGVICVECFIAVVTELKQAALAFAADPLPLTQHIRDAISATFGPPGGKT